MKKLSYLLLGAAGLTLASCSQEQAVAPEEYNGSVQVTISLPNDLATRALADLGDGYVANNLHYAVFDASEGANGALVYTDEMAGDEITFPEDALNVTVPFQLASGKTYKIAFFAQSATSEEQHVYTFAPNADNNDAVVTVNYAAMTSPDNLADDYDCFYGSKTIVVDDVKNTTVECTLTRPLAQINWGTSDYDVVTIKDDKAYGDNGEFALSTLTALVSNELSILGNTVNAAEEVTMVPFAAPSTEGFEFPYNGDTYGWLAMNYVLVSKDQELINVTLNVTNKNGGLGDITNEIPVASVPVQANYRTNIFGNLLSENVEVNVIKNADWTGMYNYEVVKSLAGLQDAAANGGTVSIDNSITGEGSTDYGYHGGVAGLFLNGGTINGNGKVLDITNATDTYDCAINTTGGTISNLVVSGNAFRSIYANNMTTNLVVEGCILGGVYPINVSGNQEEPGLKLEVSYTDLYNWTSYAGLAEASFTNCNFIKAEYSSLAPYVNTYLTNCTFGEGWSFPLEGRLAQGQKIYIKNCKVKVGEEEILLAEDNIGEYIEIETPGSWATELSDYIEFVD